LVYARGPGAEACPEQAVVREAVKKRLGYDPFFPSSDKTIIVRVLRDGERLRGEVELIDENGTQVGRREFFAPLQQCDPLVHAMALSVSIAIDPKSAETYGQGPPDATPADSGKNQADSQESAAAPPERSVARAAPASSSVSATKPAPQAPPWLWSVGLGPTVQFGSLPQPALGASAFGAIQRAAWSLAFEAELDLPVTTTEQAVELRSSSFALKALPCWHWRFASACQVTALRWLSATGNFSNSSGTGRSLSLGARVGAELPITASLSGVAYADLLVTPVPVRLLSEGHEVWRTPLFGGGLTIAAVVHFR
jgi:hypothetical protein